jgi:hypothetical protein
MVQVDMYEGGRDCKRVKVRVSVGRRMRKEKVEDGLVSGRRSRYGLQEGAYAAWPRACLGGSSSSSARLRASSRQGSAVRSGGLCV